MNTLDIESSRFLYFKKSFRFLQQLKNYKILKLLFILE